MQVELAAICDFCVDAAQRADRPRLWSCEQCKGVACEHMIVFQPLPANPTLQGLRFCGVCDAAVRERAAKELP